MTQKIYLKFKKFIELNGLFGPQSRLLVAVSGGQDSVALVHLLLELRKEWPELEVALAHFNHHLRVRAADDERFVRELARNLGLKIFVGQGRVRELASRNQLNVEEAGRLKRYEFLEKTAERWGADFILTAHTMTDQAETVLMKIFRGTGIEGLQGIRLRKGKIVRPLLGLQRSEIEEYLRGKNIEYRIDETNLDTELLRNRIRLELIPQLKKDYDPEAVTHLSQLALIAQEENEALEELIEGLWPLVTKRSGPSIHSPVFRKEEKEKKEGTGTNFLSVQDEDGGVETEDEGQRDEGKYLRSLASRKELESVSQDGRSKEPAALSPELELNLRMVKELPVAVSRRLIRKFLSVVLGLKSPSFDQTEAVLGLEEGKKFSWGKDKVLIKEGGWLKRIKTGARRNEFYFLWDGQKRLYLGENLVFEGEFGSREELGKINYDDENRCYLDANKLKFPLEVRIRKPGDRYRPLGLEGQKKLKELFQEKKIPVGERNDLPVFISEGKIIWVPGLPVAEEFKLSPDTRRVFIITKG